MAFDTLIQLHETHERLAEIDELKGDLPELLNEQKNDFNEMNDTQTDNSLKIDGLSKELKSCQKTLADHNVKFEKYNNQLLKVTNNKEYDAVLLEIDYFKKLIIELDAQILSINNEKEELSSLIENNVPLIKELSEKMKINKKELNSKMSKTNKEEQLLSKHSKQLKQKIINDKRLAQYTKFYVKYGQGMAHIARQSCSYCYTQLPPQTLVEIEYNKKIITCPSCSVFLYHKNEKN